MPLSSFPAPSPAESERISGRQTRTGGGALESPELLATRRSSSNVITGIWHAEYRDAVEHHTTDDSVRAQAILDAVLACT